MTDFDEVVRHWGKLAAQLSFLGEIALSQTETTNYLHSLSSRIKNQYSYYGYAVPISVLAVNCAYYHYDDSGFWHFFCKSLNLDCNPAIQAKLGEVIESYLRNLRGECFDERNGPFRYVSRILEECGISQYYMAPFVDFMKLLKGHHSWATVSALAYNNYKKCIPYGLPKYLNNFLADISGWHFVTDVASSLSQYERNLIGPGDLCSLPGYRPDFWVDFLKNYDGTSITKNLVKYPPQSSAEPVPQVPYVYWPGKPPCCPPFVIDQHVYMRPFGKIAIGNFNSVQKGKYIFVCYIAGEPKVIPLQSLEICTSNVALLDLDKQVESTPCSLELWFEIAGRSSGTNREKQIGKWTCTLVDKIGVEACPQYLLAPEDFLSITLQAPQDYRLQFSQLGTIKKQGEEWAVPCRSSRVDGEIIAGKLEIPIEIPIYRDVLRLESGSKILLATQKDLEENLSIEGVPGSKLELCITNNMHKLHIETGARFGGDGTISLNIKNNLGSTLEGWQESWGLLSQGTGTLEGCIIYLNLPVVMRDLSNIWSYPNEFFDALPAECAKPFRALTDVLSGQRSNHFDAMLITKFPPKIRDMAWIFAACAKVFEGANILNLDIQNAQALQNVPSETRKTLLWYLNACKVHTDGSSEQLDSLLDASIKPQAVYSPRWVEMVQLEQQRISRLNMLRTDLGSQITEWFAKVTGSSRTTYDGIIANLPGGQDLTRAWRAFYLHKQARDKQFSNIYSWTLNLVDEPGIVGTLARILQLAILKESDRKHLMAKVDVSHVPEELLPVVRNLLDDTTDDGISLLAKLFS